MTYPPPPPPYDPTAAPPPPAGHRPPADPPPEAPVTSPYGAYPAPPYAPPPYANPQYAAGKATPQYPPTASYPVLEPPAPPRSGPRVLLGLLIGAVVMMLVCVAGIIAAFALRGDGQPSAAAPDPPATRAPAPPTPAPPAVDGHTVVYEVSGDGPVGITYLKDAKGGTEQVRSVSLPWRAEVVIPEDSFVVTVIAVRLGLNEGTIACRVLVDGEERAAKQSASGNFASATCADLILG